MINSEIKWRLNITSLNLTDSPIILYLGTWLVDEQRVSSQSGIFPRPVMFMLANNIIAEISNFLQVQVNKVY